VSIDTTEGEFLFAYDEPDVDIFEQDITEFFTNGNDDYRRTSDVIDHNFNMLDGDDIVYLGFGDDVISGNDGNDIMYAGAGNDVFYGDLGDDRIYGQDGDDTLYGGAGADILHGNDGNDTIYGSEGDDALSGHNGTDKLLGGDGNDTLNGGNDTDYLYGDNGNDQIVAGAGNDTADGGAGNDTIYGGAGNDRIHGGSGDDFIAGGADNDIIYTESGNDTAMGQAGDDVLYSGSENTLDALITQILTDNAGVTYNLETNSFYQLINSTAQWATAQSNAASSTLTGLDGVNGHLVTITSETENNYITTLAAGATVWVGANDADAEGQWYWTEGPEAGQQFWQGDWFGNAINSTYSNWATLQPSILSSASDYVSFNGGNWTANTPGANLEYIIEWDATSLVTLNSTSLNGGDGFDQLFGSDGADIFRFDNTNNVDDVFNFDVAEHDAIKVSDIISFDALTDDINDFVRFTESVGDTIVSVDIDGTDNGVSFTDIARLDGVTGLDDIQLLMAGDNLIV
jgi:Ca2+-binding RTX toxin-like protein